MSVGGGEEVWLPVRGFEDFYAVSNHGRMKSLARVVFNGFKHHTRPERVLKLVPKPSGYTFVDLCTNGVRERKYVHHAVLEAFVGPCPDGHLTRHLNNDPSDNRLSNLRWGTPLENMHDKRRHGTQQVGEEIHAAILSEDDVREIRQSSERSRYVAKRFGVHETTIHDVRRRKTWKHI